MTQDGMLLTLPDGQQFLADKNLQRDMNQETQFLFSGLQNTLAIYEELTGDEETADSLKKQIAIGTGAGTRIIRLEWDKDRLDPGQSETWGGADPDDAARTKLDIIDNALDTVAITSGGPIGGPATLEVSEFSSSGMFEPLQVVVISSNFSINHTETSSTFHGTIEFMTTPSLDDTNTAEARTG